MFHKGQFGLKVLSQQNKKGGIKERRKKGKAQWMKEGRQEGREGGRGGVERMGRRRKEGQKIPKIFKSTQGQLKWVATTKITQLRQVNYRVPVELEFSLKLPQW